MQDKPRCQSCGMPLGIFEGKDNYGTNKNGSKTTEYCQFCFQKGKFTEPTLTLKQMLDKSIHFMITELKFPKEEATKLSHQVIPKLKRWQP